MSFLHVSPANINVNPAGINVGHINYHKEPSGANRTEQSVRLPNKDLSTMLHHLTNLANTSIGMLFLVLCLYHRV